MPDATRLCTQCGLPLVDEPSRRGPKRATHPGDCERRAVAERVRRNYHAAGADQARAANLWRHYKIRVDEYDRLREAQSFRCALCRRHEDEVVVPKAGRPRKDGSAPSEPVKLVVDHDHATGAVRGLLCHNCNVGLGHFEDDPAKLLAAIDYLYNAAM